MSPPSSRQCTNTMLLFVLLLSILQVVVSESNGLSSSGSRETGTGIISNSYEEYDSIDSWENDLPNPGYLRNGNIITTANNASTVNVDCHDHSDELSSRSLLQWPWSKNKTSDNQCSSYQNCTACSEVSRSCHWCPKDDECHAIGSWYGCAIGSSCIIPSNDTVDNSCHSHKNCAECSISSSLCHYCAFDDQCHAIGSLYGCSHGVNCYSNDRCRREDPEHIHLGIFDDIGLIPLVFIISAAVSVLCCSSMLFAGASALKGAYDEIIQYRIPPPEAFANHVSQSQQLQLDPILEEQQVDTVHIEGAGDCNIGNHDSEIEAPLDEGDNKDRDNEAEEQLVESHDILATEHSVVEATHLEEHDTEEEHLLMEPLLPVTAHPDPSRLPTRNRNRGGGYIRCLMGTCRVWYLFTVIGAICFVASSILLFPKVPEVNVCSDEFAWKSIIDGLTSLKVEASFQILASVQNQNRLDIALEGIAGQFKHDGQEVGTFEIERTIVAASSISDVMVTCTVVPDHWEALGLIADYYKDKLEFLVDINGSVKIKGIGFSIPIKLTNILVKANKTVKREDRHLCACPQWKDSYPTASPVLSFEEAVSYPINEVLRTKTEEIASGH